MILAPIVRGRKGEYKKELEKLARDGFVRARIDGDLVHLDEPPALDKRKNHTIEVVVDRLLVKPGIAKRLEQSIETATQTRRRPGHRSPSSAAKSSSTPKNWPAPTAAFPFPQLEPRSFSFNSPYGACPECHGLGSKYDFDPAKVIVDWSKPLFDGGLGPGGSSANLQRTLELAALAHGFDLDTPFEKLSRRVQNLILYGNPPSNRRRSAAKAA